jgi:hypothetical protein
MYPNKYSQPTAPLPYNAAMADGRPQYLPQQSENRKYQTPSEERMVKFQKLVRRYESEFFFRDSLTIRLQICII